MSQVHKIVFKQACLLHFPSVSFKHSMQLNSNNGWIFPLYLQHDTRKPICH